LNEAGAVFGFDLMYGLPDDSFAGFRQSLDFAMGLYPNHLDIFPLALLPGTRLAARAAGLGLCHLPASPYTLISSPTFSAEDMAAARRLTAACDIFYSRGKAVSWFMSLLVPLKLAPSAFLLLFADYLDAAGVDADSAENLSDREIFELQCGFVQKVFADRKAKKLLPLALDLIVYNYHYAAALMAVPPQVPESRRLAGLRTDNLRLRLAPSTRLARFSYDILELLENESGDLRVMAAMLERSGSRAVIYPNNGEIRTESLHETYVRFLEHVDETRDIWEVARESGIRKEDFEGFVKFALREGIVIIA
jgi:hypothetical protein